MITMISATKPSEYIVIPETGDIFSSIKKDTSKLFNKNYDIIVKEIDKENKEFKCQYKYNNYFPFKDFTSEKISTISFEVLNVDIKNGILIHKNEEKK